MLRFIKDSCEKALKAGIIIAAFLGSVAAFLLGQCLQLPSRSIVLLISSRKLQVLCVGIGGVFGGVFALGLVLYTTSAPHFCLSCHATKETADIGIESEVHPPSIRCTECHIRQDDLVAGLVPEGLMFAADENVINENCLRCHKNIVTNKQIAFKFNVKDIKITHKSHIERRSAKCTDCHYNVAHDYEGKTANRPTMEACFKCHKDEDRACFICHRRRSIPAPLTKHASEFECSPCHEDFREKRMRIYDIEFSHSRHLSSGIDCDRCHSNAQKHGRIVLSREGCLDCHHKAGRTDCAVCHKTEIKLARVRSCVTISCHANIARGKYLHKCVTVGGCPTCHQPTTGEHKFKTVLKGSQLCYYCHDRQDTLAVLHKPNKLGLCEECHEPHSANAEFLLKAPVESLCYKCHDSYRPRRKHAHGPAAIGGCVICHDAHESSHEKLLRKDKQALCLGCHPKTEKEITERKYVHTAGPDSKGAAPKESCTACHDPHSSDVPKQLKAPVPELCYKCHEEMREKIASFTTSHGAINSGKLCLNCHEAHGSDYPNQLRDQSMTLCLNCHDRQLETGSGKLANMKALIESNKSRHGPIREGNCTDCHNAHGSKHFRLLTEYFPQDFYAPFSVGKYALCFQCHDSALVLEKKGTILTEFRNGDENLHYLHVNDEDNGRSCRACHSVHASNRPRHIREKVTLGVWDVPINFEKSETGGNCAPGCHKPKTYDRLNPVKYEEAETK